MNRQAANYIESVGDNQHYEWQTPRHNWVCLVITIIALGILFFLFYADNRVNKEEFYIDCKCDPRQPPFAIFDINIRYDYSGDFALAQDGVTIRGKNGEKIKNYMSIYATIQQDTSHTPNAEYKIVPESFQPSNTEEHPELVLVERKVEGCVKAITAYDRMDIDANLITAKNGTPQIPLLFEEIYANSLNRIESYSESCTIVNDFTLEVFNDFWYQKSDSIKIIFGDNRTIIMPIDNYIKSTYFTNRLNKAKENGYNDELDMYKKHRFRNKLFVSPIYIGKRGWHLFNKNSSCIHVKSLQLPNATDKALNICYESPMVFDILSIEPDYKNSTKISYYSPEKIQEINERGLVVSARSITNANTQETWNFIYATLIGLVFSFLIEFIKRLYCYYKQKNYEMKKKNKKLPTSQID